TVALVRRDRPGLEYLPKIPPEAIMADVVLPGRPSDEELDADTSVTVQGLTLDASGGSARPGAADFFVVAAFSKWWVGPRRLRIEDSHAGVRGVWDRPRPLDRTLNRSARRDEAPM